MKAVIVAAGRGSRVYPYTNTYQNASLISGVRPYLNARPITYRYGGIKGGNSGGFEKVENFLDGSGTQIKTFCNQFYQTTNSLISPWIE